MAKRKRKKKAVRRFAVLFGFDTADKDRTGYLKAGKNGCAVTQDRRDATEFSLSAGVERIRDWCEFFKTEPATANWRFHPVFVTES